MTQQKRDWVRIIGITGATLALAGGLTLGGLRVAEATGYVTMPAHQHQQGGRGMMGGFDQQGGFGQQDGQGMMGGRQGRRGGRHSGQDGQGMMGGFGDQGGQGMMGGFGDQDGRQGGQGMMGGFGQQGGAQQTAGDEQLLVHLVGILTEEQSSATAVGTSESAAKAIAATRAAQITELQGYLTKWYPSAQAVSGRTGNATTVEELRQELLHHSQMLEGLNSGATYEHPELGTWVTKTLASRATEVTTLYSK